MDETSLLKIKIQVEEIITEREGMIAENKQREFTDMGMAYGEEQFNKIRNRLNERLEFLQKYG